MNNKSLKSIRDTNLWSSMDDSLVGVHFPFKEDSSMTEIKILSSISEKCAFITIEKEFSGLNEKIALTRWTKNYEADEKNQKQKHCKNEMVRMINSSDFEVVSGGFCYQDNHKTVRNAMVSIIRDLGWDGLNYFGRNKWKKDNSIK
ncbi:hypothetical protein NTH44_003720 [Vibrio metoecus]